MQPHWGGHPPPFGLSEEPSGTTYTFTRIFGKNEGGCQYRMCKLYIRIGDGGTMYNSPSQRLPAYAEVVTRQTKDTRRINQ
mmetsp:Transcript_47855/g.71263  ORF Transcript_47855/g.71263 Transcript_47855/m.71263 type:complete len:81 (+) Transcript_47855:217-459(+)